MPVDASHDDPIAPNSFTVLRMVGVGVPPYSCRGAKQTLTAIDQATNLKRTCNGKLKDISFSGFKVYKSTISCSDQRPPNFDGKWPGLTVVIDCIAELSYTPDEGETQQRPAVPGSWRMEGAHAVYRPRLTCKILTLSTDTDEYDAACNWTMDVEEIEVPS
jgi:hypothetical protein